MKIVRSLLCAACVAWLAACGPGTGGTGTGETTSLYLDAFGARAGNVCTSAIGGTLACTDTPAGVGSAAATATTGGTLAVHFTDSESGGEVHVVIDGNTLHFEARCSGLRFEGDWGVAGSGDARFFGSLVGFDTAAATPATLALEVIPGRSDALQLTLRQADGRLLLGPLVLLRVAEAVTAPAICR